MNPLTQNKWLRSFASAFLALFIAVGLGASTVLAQTTYYVDITNGDDANAGTSEIAPLATLGAALALVDDDDVIVVKAANTPGYTTALGESATLTIDKDVEIRFDELDAVAQALFPDADWVIDADVEFTGDGFVTIMGGLTLTSGSLTIDGDKVQIGAGQTVRVVAGTLSETPNYLGAIHITYAGDDDITAGGEIPANGDLNGGTLKNEGTAGTVSIARNLDVAAFEHVGDAATSITGDLEVASAVDITGDGNVSVSGDVDVAGNFMINGNGDVTVSGTIDFGSNDLVHFGAGAVQLGAVDSEDGGLELMAGGDIVVTGQVELYNGGILTDGASSGSLEMGSVLFRNNDNLANVALDLDGSGDVTINGTLTFDPESDDDGADSQYLANILHNAGAGVLTISGGVVAGSTPDTDDDDFTDEFIVNYTGNDANASFGPSTFHTFVAGTGTTTLTGDVSIEENLTNNGEIDVENNTLTLTGRFGQAYDNNGNEITGSGTLVFAYEDEQTFRNTGDLPSVQVNADANVTFEGNAEISGSLMVAADGIATFEGPLEVAVDIDNSGTFTAKNTLEVAVDIDNSGTFTAENTLEVDGSVQNSGTFTAENTLEVDGSVQNSGAFTTQNDVTVAENFTNSGTGEVNISGPGAINPDFLVEGDFTNTSSSASALIISGINSATIEGTLETSDGELGVQINLTVGGFAMSGPNTVILDMNGNRLSVEGSFERTGGRVDNMGELAFISDNPGMFTAGPQLAITNLTVNKPDQELVITQSINVYGNFTNVDGVVALGDRRIRMRTDNTTAWLDGGMTSTVEGGISFLGDGPYNIRGDATYTNIRVNLNPLVIEDVVVVAGQKATFSGKLELLSRGIVATGDLIPSDAEGDEPRVIVEAEDANARITGANFNNPYDHSYDLEYITATVLSANALIGAELDNNVRDLIVSVDSDNFQYALQLPAGDAEVNRNLEISADAVLESNGADRTLEVKGNLLVHGGAILRNDDNQDFTVELTGENAEHVIAGLFEQQGTGTNILEFQKSATLIGDADYLVDNRIIQANVEIEALAVVSVEAIQEIQGAVTVAADGDLSLALSNRFVDPADPANNERGRVSGTVTNNGKLTFDADTDVSGGTLVTGADSETAFAFDVYAFGPTGVTTVILDGNSDATYVGDGFLVVAHNQRQIDANRAAIPNVRIPENITGTELLSDLEVSEMLDLNEPLIGVQDLTLSGNANLFADVENNVVLKGADNEMNLGDVATRTIDGTLTSDADAGEVITITNDRDGNAILDVTGLVTFAEDSGTLHLGATTRLRTGSNLLVEGGALTMGSGDWLGQFDGGTYTIEEDFEVRNFYLEQALIVDGEDGKALIITDYLRQRTSGAFTNDNDPVVRIGDGAIIGRRIAADLFTDAPVFDGTVNLYYQDSPGTDIVTGLEVPSDSDLLQELTVSRFIVLGSAMTVNSTANMNADVNNNAFNFNIADDAEIKINIESPVVGSIFTQPIVGDVYTLEYYADGITGNELVGTNASIIVGDGITGSTLTLNRDYDLAKITVNANSVLNLGGETVNSTQPVVNLTTYDADGSSITNGSIRFNGAEAQTLLVDEPFIFNNVSLIIDNEYGVDLSGAEVWLTGSAIMEFRNGVFRTGDNFVRLRHQSTTQQGFTRVGDDAGFIVGNVQKLLPSGAGNTASNTLVFPVGQVDVNSPEVNAYAPFEVTFNNPSLIPGNIFMTVNHKGAEPQDIVETLGVSGWPIADGVKEGEDLARYPDTFYWQVVMSNALPQGLVYEVIAERENFSDYVFTGNSEVVDIRLVNRSASSVNNPWLLVGDAANYVQSEQIGVIPDVHPRIAATNVTGVLRGGQGTIFTYGLKSNLVFNDIADYELNAGQTSDPVSLIDLTEGGTRPYAYTAEYDDDFVTIDITDGEMTVTADEPVEETTVTINLLDALSDPKTQTFTVKVNPALAVVEELDDVTLNVGDERVVELGSVFGNGTEPYIYQVNSSDDTIVGVDRDGTELTLEALAAGTATVTVTVTDATGAVATDEFDVTVNEALAIGVEFVDIELRAGDGRDQKADTVKVDDVSIFFTGGTAPITYSAVSASPDTVSVLEGDANTVWYVIAGLPSIEPGAHTVTVTATDDLGASLSQEFDVTVIPALGDINADQEVNSFDARQILLYNVGLETFNALQVDLADVNNDEFSNSFDASVILRYAVNEPGVTIPFVAKLANVSAGQLQWGDLEQNTEEGTVTVPVIVSTDGQSGIYSIDFAANFDTDQLSVESVNFTELPDGWVSIHNTDDGELRFALAGARAMSARQVATVTFKLGEGVNSVNITAQGFVNNSQVDLGQLEVKEIPAEFALNQNYPNPFNPTTKIGFQLPVNADVTIEVYNAIGQRVMTLVNESMSAGVHTVDADFTSLTSGIYVYRIVAQSEAETFISTRKMTLIK